MAGARAGTQRFPHGKGADSVAATQALHGDGTAQAQPGQFWGVTGDEALLSLQQSRRNGRWRGLFPHMGCADPSGN